MNLAKVQQAFQDRVLHGANAIEAIVLGTPAFDTATRLGIYEYAFTARLIEALTKTWPVLHAVMGEQKFAGLIHAYAMHRPPTHFSVRYYGNDLPEFISGQYKGVKAKGLAELANWEWLLATAFDAADMNAVTRESLSVYAPEQWPRLQFKLSPSFLRITLHTNAVQWWRAISDDSRRPTRWRATKAIEWAVWRSEFKTYFRSLMADEACVLECVLRNESFSSLCDVLADKGDADNAPLRAATMLSQWLNDGWIVDITEAANSTPKI